ncbi:hypothetical protein ACHWQZ_G006190 [Mnemiopsis leidyi]
MVSKLGVYSKEEVRDIVRAKWEELTAASSNAASSNAGSAAASPVSDPPQPLDRSSRTRRKPATYRIPDENEIFAEEDKPRRGRRSAPDPPKKRKSNNHGKAKLKKTLTLLERKQQKEEKKLKAAEEKSRAKGNSPAPIRIKISLKGKNGKNGSGANSRAQSDNESVDSEGPNASKAESEISDTASDAEKGNVGEICEICQQGGDLLLCSACNRAFHTDCVNLDNVPEGEWFCSKCDEDGSSAAEEEDDEHVDFCKRCKDGGELLCCENCTSAYHLQCTNPPLEDVPNGKWQCERCACPPLTGKVQSFITWRYKEAEEKDGGKKAKQQREYLVKFHNLSYWRCEWVQEVQLEVFCNSKLRNYLRKSEGEAPPTLEEVEDTGEFTDPNVKLMINAGIPPSWFRVHRVLRVRNIKNSPTICLVKWRDLSYEYATWEPEGEEIPGLEEAMEDYKKFKKQNDKKYRCIRTGKSNARYQGDPSVKFEKQPAYIDATGGKLHSYQLEGLNWLRHCWSQERNTILADEMGLGKTIQTISFLNSLMMEGHCTAPFLISVPLSTLVNWEREFEFWAPDLYVLTYVGTKENRAITREHEFSYSEDAFHRNTTKAQRVRKGTQLKFDVLLTSYELINVDNSCLSSIEWSVLVVDEAHRLKNNRSLYFRTLTVYPIQYRLLLTGTPLQNNLEELFHLLNFMESKTFNSLEDFQNQFDNIGKEEQVQKLHDLLSPHLLRRLKQDVLTDIPAKSECLVRVELSKEQKKFYKLILTRNYEALTAKGYGNCSLINIMMELKKCSNHAYLVAAGAAAAPRNRYGAYEGNALVQGSGKLILLKKMLAKLKETGHRVLIFSQMRIMLDLLEEFLDHLGYKFERIDGAITGADRQEAIDRFNNPKSQSFVFLLSTRAGGLGINLATADTVFIYDSDWNPHNDIQALSRAHRIGQFNKVMIYRFVTRNSIEEKITQVAKHKMMLTHLVVRPGMGAATLSKTELDSILKFGSKDLFGGAEDKQEDELIDYPDEMVEQLLDREQKGSVESKEQLLDDYFSTFKVASYSVKKIEEVKEEEEEKEPEKEIISDDFALDDPSYWEKLLRHHYEQHQEGEYAKMGKGKRIRKAVNYYTEGLESLSTKKDEDEFDDHDDNDFSDEESGPRKKMRRSATFPVKPNEAALPPLLARVGGQLEVLGFNSRQRRSFLNAVMRYGMPLSDAYHTNWRPRDLKNKTEKEFNAYVSLFMRHLCEPDNGNSHYFADGVPKEGLPRQQVLARIGVMGLIRRKVNEYAHINGDLPSRPGSPDSVTTSHTQMSTPASSTPQQAPSTPQPAPETAAPAQPAEEASPTRPEKTPAAANQTESKPAETDKSEKKTEDSSENPAETEGEQKESKDDEKVEAMETESEGKEDGEKKEETPVKEEDVKKENKEEAMETDEKLAEKPAEEAAEATEPKENEKDDWVSVWEKEEKNGSSGTNPHLLFAEDNNEMKALKVDGNDTTKRYEAIKEAYGKLSDEEKNVFVKKAEENKKSKETLPNGEDKKAEAEKTADKKEEKAECKTEKKEETPVAATAPPVEEKPKKKFVFNICDRGFTELHNIWREEHFSGNTSIWSRLHDYWLLVGVIYHGYGRWQDIINDLRFNILNEPFGGDRRLEISGEVVDKIKFMSRRFKLLEQALVAEAQVNRAVELGIQQNPNHPVMSLNARAAELECLAESHQHLARESLAGNRPANSVLRKVLSQLEDILAEMKNDVNRLPVAMSKIPTVTERLQMTERNILNRLLAARNLENGDKSAAAIIPGVNPAPPIVYSSPPTSTNIGSSVTPGMKIQPKPIANSAALSNQLKNNNTILSPLTQHLQAALKQHQAIQQQQLLSQQLQNVFLQQQQQQAAAAAAAVAKSSNSPNAQKPSDLMANRLQSIIRSQAAHLGLIRPQNATTSTPNIVLNNNLAGVIQKQSTSQSSSPGDIVSTTASILKSVLEHQQAAQQQAAHQTHQSSE